MASLDFSKVQQVAEAICGNLHSTDFQFIGESDQGASTWFTRGVKPKNMRVEVQRSSLAPYVIVNIEHFNVASPTPFRVRRTLRIPTTTDTGVLPDDELARACADASVWVLLVFKEVLEGTGTAGIDAAREKLAHDAEYD